MTIPRSTILLGTVSVATLALSFAYGVAVGRYEIFPFNQIRTVRHLLLAPEREEPAPGEPAAEEPRPYGRWTVVRQPADDASLDREAVERLSTLGYLGGYTPASERSGTTLLDVASARDGLTLFSSGHSPVAYLISLDGEVVHEWAVSFDELWPTLPFEPRPENKQYIRRAHVFPNGDLLAVFEYIGIVKLDRDSRVLWKRLGHNHHDLYVAADGSIVTVETRSLTSEEAATQYGFDCRNSTIIADDHIVLLSPSGSELQRVSLLEAFYRSDYATVLCQHSRPTDIFHTNSVQLLEAPNPRSRLKESEILLSVRNLHAIATVDLVEKRVSWMLAGKWFSQHQARLLKNGNILLLDNMGGNPLAPLEFDQSQVLEVDPLTQQVVWRYRGSELSPFFTWGMGYVQRLDNGNTLVTESNYGRIFEVTEEGRIVWEYVSPHRAGDRDELVATIMGAQRIAEDDVPFLSSDITVPPS